MKDLNRQSIIPFPPRCLVLAVCSVFMQTLAHGADWPAEQFQLQIREPVTAQKADIQQEIEFEPGALDSIWETVSGSGANQWEGLAAESELWMNEIGGLFRAGNHRAPFIEPIVSDNGTPKFRVYLFPFVGSRTRNHPALVGAGGGYQLSHCAGSTEINWISYNASLIPPGSALPKSKYGTYSHETFHALEYGDQLMANCMKGNFWITEGLAEAAGLYLMNRKWPNYAQTIGNYSAVGLRHYDWTLNFTSGRRHVASRSVEGRTGYLTSSFWLFFAENFGGVKVFPHFLAKPVSEVPDKQEQVEWLDERLRSEPNIQSGLYLAYPHFVTEFASYGGSRYNAFASRNFGQGEAARTAWLNEAFSGCRNITLTPDNAVQEISVSIQKIAAICIRVKYEGFSGNVTSQMEVINERLDKIDQLHLGWAWKFGPDDELNCYRQHKSRKTLWPPCVIKAFSQTGPSEGTYARTWAEESLDFGTSSGLAERVFILSNVAEEPWKTREISEFSFKAGATYSTRNGEPAEPTHNMPVQRKTRPPNPAAKIGKEALYGLKTDPPVREDGMTGVGLQKYVPNRSKGGKPKTAGGYSVAINQLKYGQTGEVLGSVVLQAQDPRNQAGPVSSLVCKDAATKPIGEVTQSDESAFRITIDTDVCQLGPGTMQQCEDSGCPVIEHVSAEVNVSFGWRQFNSTAPVDIRTKGIEAYIDTMPDSLEEAMTFGAGTAIPDTTGIPGDGEGDSSGDSSGSSSVGGSLQPCTCTCDELAATDAAAIEFKARMAAGEQPSMSEISGFNRCTATCQREYMVCRMEEADAKKRAEEEAREQLKQSAEPCDCSCDALASFDKQAKELQSRFEAGGTVPNEALQGLVRCAQECQAQHLACRTQGLNP